VSIAPETPRHTWSYRRLVLPVLALLRMGATPQRLAWSIALGAAVGLNPVLGTTTVLCLVLAFAFRLNVVAAQIANHAMLPLEVLLVIPFIRLGSRVFRTAALPVASSAFLSQARHAPLMLLRQVWVWEWHAFLLWLLIALAFVPVAATALTPLLERLDRRVKRHQYPVVRDVI
jgi:uncharacterized protein (DUF2062 family)